MTKTEFAGKLVELVENFRWAGDTTEEIVDAVESLLLLFEPIDPEGFAEWEFPTGEFPEDEEEEFLMEEMLNSKLTLVQGDK